MLEYPLLPRVPQQQAQGSNASRGSRLSLDWGNTLADQQRIWAPWRIGYVSGDADAAPPPPEPDKWQTGAETSCFLCRAAAQFSDPGAAAKDQWLLRRGEQTVALLNRFPYANGHLLVSPLRHVGALGELTDAEHLEAMHVLAQLMEMATQKLKAQGFNVGLNLGTVAGAGVPGHLHWHVVPRWEGDHNFMPTLAGIRVIPQSLEAVWEAISDYA